MAATEEKRQFARQATPEFWQAFYDWKNGKAQSPFKIIHPDPHQGMMRQA